VLNFAWLEDDIAILEILLTPPLSIKRVSIDGDDDRTLG